MSQTKQIQHQLEQEVADIMDAESFADLVFIDPDPVPETSKKEEGRTGFFAKRNKDKETDAATKAQTPQENDKETVASAGHTGYKETAVDKTTEQVQESDKQEEQIEKLQKWGRIGQWFQTFCWMHIPIFGFWYMVVLAVRKRTPKENLRPSICTVPSACDAVGAYHFVCVLSNGTEFRRTDPCLH